MIEKNVNVYKKSIKRVVAIDQNLKRVNILDTRYYARDDKYYPSVTSILQYFPKNKFFETWLKDVGHNADIIARKAADEGTQVHDAIERYLLGEKISWMDDNGYSKYSLEIWKMILKFHDFWSTYKPTLIESEIHLFSDKYMYAGTCDLVIEMDGVKWLLDIKTSNSLYVSYDLQLSAYAQAWNELYEEKIDKIGLILPVLEKVQRKITRETLLLPRGAEAKIEIDSVGLKKSLTDALQKINAAMSVIEVDACIMFGLPQDEFKDMIIIIYSLLFFKSF